MHKSKVLDQYRSFLRAIRLIEDETDRQNTYQQIQREFRSHAQQTDPYAIQLAITEGATAVEPRSLDK